ncbi:hypothetical protein F8M41_013322 [Gigaspora margarita]|uniref:Uncharacterized protein n=1 Tax=Gigaspora margarita TaxID=4874 RepID=A0A8H4ASB5_GIGMA|nr:hypothetical protein F8M41_013322 [Gigaspora margarita]
MRKTNTREFTTQCQRCLRQMPENKPQQHWVFTTTPKCLRTNTKEFTQKCPRANTKNAKSKTPENSLHNAEGVQGQTYHTVPKEVPKNKYQRIRHIMPKMFKDKCRRIDYNVKSV